jgi:hypothetical protein
MRHQQVLETDLYRRLETPAAWPAGPTLVHLAQAEPAEATAAFAPTPAAPDLPASVGMMLLGAYALLIFAFALASMGSAQSVFAITICALFVAIFFAVPRIFLAVEPKAGNRPSFDRFMRMGIETLTGHSRGRDALVQILIVPVFLTLGALAMAVASAIIL